MHRIHLFLSQCFCNWDRRSPDYKRQCLQMLSGIGEKFFLKMLLCFIQILETPLPLILVPRWGQLDKLLWALCFVFPDNFSFLNSNIVSVAIGWNGFSHISFWFGREISVPNDQPASLQKCSGRSCAGGAIPLQGCGEPRRHPRAFPASPVSKQLISCPAGSSILGLLTLSH